MRLPRPYTVATRESDVRMNKHQKGDRAPVNKPALPVRFAVIGCGALAKLQHLPNLAASRKATLQLCCDLDESALTECRERWGVPHTTTDLAEAVNHPEVDAICLATTEELRKEPIALAAEAGKPVYTEKPLARSLSEAYEIRDIVHRSGIPFCVGHNRRSSPAMVEAHRIFRDHMENPQPCPWRFDREGPELRPQLDCDGAPGFTCRINDDWYSWKARGLNPERCFPGPMLYEMTHFVDLANWFISAQPVEAVALDVNMLNHGAIITYDNGSIATITMSASGTFGYPKELYEITGNAGFVAVDHMLEVRTGGIANVPDARHYPLQRDPFPELGRDGGLSGWMAKHRAAERRATDEGGDAFQYAPFADKGHAHQLDRFVDEMRGEGAVVCGVDDSILATEVCFTAIEAAHTKRAVRVEEVRQQAAIKT